MAKQSAGILLYRRAGDTIEVLLAHPGGPFFAKKDDGVWSIPKGEFTDGEEPLQAAEREFQEETGTPVPQGERKDIGKVKLSSGKTIYAWAVEGNLDASNINSNTFSLEWPPKSGQKQEFPEIDRAEWFILPKAVQKLNKSQVTFIERLAAFLKLNFDATPSDTPDSAQSPKQASLF